MSAIIQRRLSQSNCGRKLPEIQRHICQAFELPESSCELGGSFVRDFLADPNLNGLNVVIWRETPQRDFQCQMKNSRAKADLSQKVLQDSSRETDLFVKITGDSYPKFRSTFAKLLSCLSPAARSETPLSVISLQYLFKKS